MGLAENYSAETREHLQRIPVWEPGDHSIVPGTVGRFKKGVLYRRGDLTEFWPSAVVEIAETAGSPNVSFFSDKGLDVRVGARATVEPAGAGAHARLAFSREGATVFHGTKTRRRRIANLYSLLTALPSDLWDDRDVLITEVETAGRYTVLCSASASWQVDIGGDADAITALLIADASVVVSPRSGAGYSRQGGGPLLVTAYGRQGWRKKDWEPLEADQGASAPLFEEIDVSDPIVTGASDARDEPGLGREP